MLVPVSVDPENEPSMPATQLPPNWTSQPIWPP